MAQQAAPEMVMQHSSSGAGLSGAPSPRSKRNILVAVDLQDQSLKCLQWAEHEMYRPGDVLHLVHVARILSPQTSVQHGFPGSTYTIPDVRPINENVYISQVREIIKMRFTNDLDRRHIPHSLALFLDTDNAPASAVCNSIFRVAEEIQPCIIVMACHNKAYGWDTMFIGSVADYAIQHSTFPLMIIRDYKPPDKKD